MAYRITLTLTDEQRDWVQNVAGVSQSGSISGYIAELIDRDREGASEALMAAYEATKAARAERGAD